MDNDKQPVDPMEKTGRGLSPEERAQVVQLVRTLGIIIAFVIVASLVAVVLLRIFQ